MGDFTPDDLFDAIDRAARDLLARAGLDAPPVDGLHLAQVCGLRVEYVEPDDDPQPGRFGARPPRRPRGDVVQLHPDQTEESQHIAAARAVARRLVPDVLTKLGVAPGTENRSAQTQLVGLIAPRLMLPTKWFFPDARKADFDLVALKDLYPTAGYELIAWRLLDAADEPCVIAVVEDGTVAGRRANTFPATKKLTGAEAACVERVAAEGEPARARADGWTAWGWPVPGIPYGRIILRAVPDDV